MNGPETTEPLRTEAVGSSNIDAFSFDPETDTLTVDFLSGDAYDYFNVPQSVYRQWQAARSYGEFFARNIRNRYAYERK